MSVPEPAPAKVVLQLNVELSPAAVREFVEAITAVPGARLSVVDPGVFVPSPREPVDDQVRIDPRSRRVVRRDEVLKLTKREFELLHYLCARPEEVHERSTLMSHVWGEQQAGKSRTIDVHIRRLRAKLGHDGRFITTVRGIGYRFDGPHRIAIEPVPSAVLTQTDLTTVEDRRRTWRLIGELNEAS